MKTLWLRFSVICIFLVLGATMGLQQTLEANDKYLIDTIDFENDKITKSFEIESGPITIEAYKSYYNNAIMELNDTINFKNLYWLSIGSPSLILTQDPARNETKRIFHFTKQGFHVLIDLFNTRHQQLLQEAIKRKYNIEVSSKQIVYLVPHKFECFIKFIFKRKKYLINGRAVNLNETPVEIEFYAPVNTRERDTFEEKIENDNDFDVTCKLNSKPNGIEISQFILGEERMKQLGLKKVIFGSSSSDFLTKKQINELASKVFNMFNIIDDFHVSETSFKKFFAEEVLKNFNKTLSYERLENILSKRHLQTSNFSRVLKLRRICSNKKEYVHLGRKLKRFNRTLAEFSKFFGDDFLNFVKKRLKHWARVNVSVDAQLDELNCFEDNSIEWLKEGEFSISATRVQGARLDKELMPEKIVFKSIFSENYLSSFHKTFTINTLNYLNSIISNDEEIAEKKEITKMNLKNFEERNSLFKFNSKILTLAEMEKLIEFGEWHNNSFKLLYRATRDGFKLAKFHELCDGYENTLLVLKTNTGFVFGGFTTRIWNLSNTITSYDRDAFIYSLRRNVTAFEVKSDAQKMPVLMQKYAIMVTTSNIGFGYDLLSIEDDSDVNLNSFLRYDRDYDFPEGFNDRKERYNASVFVAGPCDCPSNTKSCFRLNEMELFWIK